MGAKSAVTSIGLSAVPTLSRGAIERLLALGYGLTYDAIVRRFPPYEALLDEIAVLVGRSVSAGVPRSAVRILDVSCGTGTVAARLAADGYTVVGLDSVEHLVNVAQRRYGPTARGTSFHHLDIARDPLPGGGAFDVVVSMHTLYWHPNPTGLMTACRRALKPDAHGIFLTYGRAARVGRTFAEIRKRQSLWAAMRALRWLVPTATFEAFRRHPLHYLTRDEFGHVLARAGFSVLESRETFLAGLSLLAWARAGATNSAS